MSNLAIIFTVLLVIVVLSKNLYDDKKYIDDTSQLDKINIVGNYAIRGESEAYPLPEDGVLPLKNQHHVTIEGYFNKDIPVNIKLIMRIDNMKVKMFLNDEEFYSFGEPNTYPSYAKSPGDLWSMVVSPGIKQTDKVRIELYNVYKDHVQTTFSTFLNNMYAGYESDLILEKTSEKMMINNISMFIVFFGIISIILSGMMARMKQPVLKLLYFGGLCISLGVWFFIDFDVQFYLFSYPVFNNSLDILSLQFSLFFLISYFGLYLESKCKYLVFGLASTFLFSILITTLLQYLGVRDYYESLLYIQIASLIYTPIVVLSILYEKKKFNNKELNKLVFPISFLAIGIIGDAIFNLFDFIPSMIWFRFSFLIFCLVQFFYFTRTMRSVFVERTRIKLLEELAYKDSLTGVGNRTAYMKRVKQFDEQLSNKMGWSVFVFDINNLKTVNDTLGHEVGDQLIQRAAMILLTIFKEEEIYRIGGDEFVVIRESEPLERNDELIKKLNEEIKRSNLANGNEQPVSIASAVATYDGNKDRFYKDVFARADMEMYRNKEKMKRND